MASEPQSVQVRVYGHAEQPTLIYLPGLHGDWTLIGGFRKALAGRVRFVEMTYPRTLSWSLDDYAAGVIDALNLQGIHSGWLLAESFGSQVLWPLLFKERFHPQAVVLAGGFGRHPARWAVRLAERLTGRLSLRLITTVLFGYARVARWRFRKEPQVLAGVNEFIARRTELDRQAAMHRLHLIAANDPAPLAAKAPVPVYAITGLVDPVVPWLWARGWLQKHCSSLKDYRIIKPADHNVLSTASHKAARQILSWMGVT